jgi:hypothetical protein
MLRQCEVGRPEETNFVFSHSIGSRSRGRGRGIFRQRDASVADLLLQSHRMFFLPLCFLEAESMTLKSIQDLPLPGP